MGSEEFKSVEDIRQKAYSVLREKLPQSADSYCDIRSGSDTGSSFRHNREALDRIRLRTRLLTGINIVNTETTILNTKINTPIMTAPIAGTALPGTSYEAVIRGCVKAGTIAFIGYPQSKEAILSFREIEGRKMVWIIKPLKNLEEFEEAFKVAEEAGCIATGIDIDSAAGLQTGFTPSLMTTLAKSYWSFKTGEELRRIRSLTKLPFVVKGIMCLEDALEAVEAGADALVISNHGGLALDYAQAPIEVLPEIVRAIGGKVDILVDSGFRYGTDVLKGLALGAKGVLIGRPTLWGFYAGGADGVAKVIQLMTEELARAMKLTGVASVRAVPSHILVKTNSSL